MPGSSFRSIVGLSSCIFDQVGETWIFPSFSNIPFPIYNASLNHHNNLGCEAMKSSSRASSWKKGPLESVSPFTKQNSTIDVRRGLGGNLKELSENHKSAFFSNSLQITRGSTPILNVLACTACLRDPVVILVQLNTQTPIFAKPPGKS